MCIVTFGLWVIVNLNFPWFFSLWLQTKPEIHLQYNMSTFFYNIWLQTKTEVCKTYAYDFVYKQMTLTSQDYCDEGGGL